MDILLLTPYPEDTAPSQRFRFEHYCKHLPEGVRINRQSFISKSTWDILYKPGHTLAKAWGIFSGFCRRTGILFLLYRYDYVFIHREASPVGPPIFEYLISKVFRKKIIYDFDDAIWLSNTSEHNKIAARLKWHQKVKQICKWSYRVSVGNTYLGDYAREFNSNVVLLPTVVDTDGTHHYASTNKVTNTTLKLGWTGTHSTMSYLYDLFPVLERLSKELDFELIVISDKAPEKTLPNMTFIKWQKVSEREDLLRFQIGLMPLTDDIWARGKCGFKAIQYMSLGIPAAVSPVGVNTEIVRDNYNGVICATDEDWYNKLKFLLTNEETRQTMGVAARETIVQHYSVNATTSVFWKLFE